MNEWVDQPFMSDGLTFRQALKQSLIDFLVYEELDTKRPWGYSCYTGDIAKAMVENGVIKGSFDEDGYLAEYDHAEYKTAMNGFIDSIITNIK